MINAIGEAGLQQAVRPQYTAEVQSEEMLVREREKLRQDRPVENTGDSQQPSMDMEQNDQEETTARNRIEDGQVIVEHYDAQGRLVSQNPPGYLPLNETV